MDLPEIGSRCCAWKIRCAEQDERDTGLRRMYRGRRFFGRLRGFERRRATASRASDGFWKSLAVLSKRGRTFTVRNTMFHGGSVDACGDHRIVMAVTLAAALCGEEITILGAECVDKSYPGFWKDFADLGGAVEMN